MAAPPPPPPINYESSLETLDPTPWKDNTTEKPGKLFGTPQNVFIIDGRVNLRVNLLDFYIISC